MKTYVKVGAGGTVGAPIPTPAFGAGSPERSEGEAQRPEPKVGAGGTVCRPGCGACCIAPSISSLGKPAGVPCGHLTADLRCGIFGRPERPACCGGLQASLEMCGENREQALAYLGALERATAPG